jgi:60 kDa SS-A/Ro ribonucleoprotein
MSKSYSSFVKKNTTVPATAPIRGREKDMAPNSGGGFSFVIDKWSQLDRFLILGAADATYYASRQKLVVKNTDNLMSCINENGQRVVQRIVEISKAGRAPSQDPALFALALVATQSKTKEDRLSAWKAIPEVARIGTHLLHYVSYVDDLGGWGRGQKKSIANWFASKKPESLALQMLKYKQRDGWSMRDVMRISHPHQFFNLNEQQNAIMHWTTKGWDTVGEQPHPDPALSIIWAAERARVTTSETEVAKLVNDYGLPWEAIDTKWLNSEIVWEALVQHIKPEALLRNLSRLSANKFVGPMSALQQKVIEILTNQESILANRLHPMKVLVGMRTYASGHGIKGSLSWTPDNAIMAAIEDCYQKSFGTVVPANKRTLLALDISSSMTMGNCSGMPITPREASAAMAMITARTEPQHHLVGFESQIVPLKINARMSINDVISYIDGLSFGATNIGATFEWAQRNKVPCDTIVVLTDNEVNSGVQPIQALDAYKKATGIDTKLVVVGMTATEFSVADASRKDNLDVVGMDVNTPNLISNFSRGDI